MYSYTNWSKKEKRGLGTIFSNSWPFIGTFAGIVIGIFTIKILKNELSAKRKLLEFQLELQKNELSTKRKLLEFQLELQQKQIELDEQEKKSHIKWLEKQRITIKNMSNWVEKL